MKLWRSMDIQPTNEPPTADAPIPEASTEAAPITETSAVPVEAAKSQTSWRQFFLDLLETILLAAALYLGINAISARVRVDGFSMEPTLQNGEYVLVSRLAYRLGEPQRGDIIVLKYPGEPKQDLIKRIIGLPGDKVEVRDLHVVVNDQQLVEPYIAAAPTYSGTWEVPPGYLFVLGDNRNDSSDSRSWGMLPLENVIGKALVIYWPPPQWKLIYHFDIAVTAPQ
ncbi:MAG: signal peptidase I [Anaerolineae bacterium]|nr:signal peptidase I [Anaerolineae bacterium]MDL1925409.1 signal peptidase I [Anaerolineae bacterium AMX1]